MAMGSRAAGTADEETKQWRGKEHVDRVATWARRATSLLTTPRINQFLDNFLRRSEQLGTGLQHLQHLAQSAQAMNTLFTRNGGTSQDSIAQFRATLDLIDVGMTFVRGVPLIGQLWSDYYSPMTRAILNQLQIIFDIQDRQGREHQLVEWMINNAADPASGVAPRITPYLAQYFPGGQPVLNFMFALVNGHTPTVTSAVESFFVEHEDQFNAGLEERDQLETESTAEWYNPFSWVGAETHATNLLDWVTQHSRTVWAQLYGDLPYTLQGGS